MGWAERDADNQCVALVFDEHDAFLLSYHNKAADRFSVPPAPEPNTLGVFYRDAGADPVAKTERRRRQEEGGRSEHVYSHRKGQNWLDTHVAVCTKPERVTSHLHIVTDRFGNNLGQTTCGRVGDYNPCVIASGDGRVGGSGPRIVWILHEMEITEHSVPRHEKFTMGARLCGNQISDGLDVLA